MSLFSNVKVEHAQLMQLPAAHAIVAKAKLGNLAATRTVLATLQGAEAGGAVAMANGQQLSAAEKLQTRAELVGKWVDAAAAQRILHPTTQWG